MMVVPVLVKKKRSSWDSFLWIAQLYLHVIFFVFVVGLSSSLPSENEFDNPVIMAVNTTDTSSIGNWIFSNSSSVNRTVTGTNTISSSDGIGLSEPQKRKKRRKMLKKTTTTTIARNASVDKDDRIIRHDPNTTVESISILSTFHNASSFCEISAINASVVWNESASIGQQHTILPKTRSKRRKIKKRLSSKENAQYKAPTEKSSAISPNDSTTTTIVDHHEDPTKSIRVSCLTWNLAEESPSPASIPSTFLSKFQHSDFVLVSIQECESIQPRRTEGRRSRFIREYCVQNLCGPTMQYVPIAMHSLGGIQLLLFCKRHWLSHLRNVQCCDVACGIGNTFHNKGAIGAFVTINHPSPQQQQQLQQQQQQQQRPQKKSSSRKKRRNDTANDLTLLFVSAHLEAHIHNVEGRNNNFWRILTEFSSQAPIFLRHKTTNRSTYVITTSTTTDAQQQREEGYDNAILHQTDYVFFCGDLNYRLDLPREMVEHHIILQQQRQTADWLPLLRHDQLLSTISQGRAFPFFQEGKITFAPTFKLDPFSFQTYDTSSKQRIPAWTDRILFLSNPPHTVKVLEYDSVPHATHSDHRPVYGTFLLHKRATSSTSKHP